MARQPSHRREPRRRTARPTGPTAAGPTAACARFGCHRPCAGCHRPTIGPVPHCVWRYRPVRRPYCCAWRHPWAWWHRWPWRPGWAWCYRRRRRYRRAVVQQRRGAGQTAERGRGRNHREVSCLNSGVLGRRRTAPIRRLWTTRTDVDKPSFTRAISTVVIHAVDCSRGLCFPWTDFARHRARSYGADRSGRTSREVCSVAPAQQWTGNRRLVPITRSGPAVRGARAAGRRRAASTGNEREIRELWLS